jgi:hypothetical protein
MGKPAVASDCEIDEAEAERRRDAGLLRALSTPHKRQKELKVGRRRLPGDMEKRDEPDDKRNDRDSVGNPGSK